MDTYTTFNKVIAEYFQRSSSETIHYINQKFLDSKRNTYYGFFDDFLYEYGIISLNLSPTDIVSNNYDSYVNCTKNNIFKEEKGITEISTKLSHSSSEKALAKYVYTKLTTLKAEDFINWNSELNNG
ncbi:hypothetical protein HX049_01420 [Myroides odoratimimus]|uniref:hypothetical protein n=1 Tax=Myroides odoratimimus TaxID=76832 RepID=UPI0025769738|nr:hypothetical protein [Myroides odoratimimus]MDM1395846.1 hypothetical protein [Myroides odoratimimus]